MIPLRSRMRDWKPVTVDGSVCCLSTFHADGDSSEAYIEVFYFYGPI
jgi:hypothetical protein